MNDINEDLRQSIKVLDSLIPQIDHSINSMSEKMEKLEQFKLVWRAGMKDSL